MIKIRDERLGPEINLCNLNAGETFIWNEYPCIRLDYGQQKCECKEDHFPCMLLSSGQYMELSRTAWVVPIKVEVTIVE